jgi:hypothetical protein
MVSAHVKMMQNLEHGQQEDESGRRNHSARVHPIHMHTHTHTHDNRQRNSPAMASPPTQKSVLKTRGGGSGRRAGGIVQPTSNELARSVEQGGEESPNRGDFCGPGCICASSPGREGWDTASLASRGQQHHSCTSTPAGKLGIRRKLDGMQGLARDDRRVCPHVCCWGVWQWRR